MRTTLRILALALLVSATFASVRASTLNGPFPESSTPDMFDGCPGCVQLAYVSNSGVVSSNGNFTATLNAAVYEDPSNTFCAGCLDFVYQISNAAGSTDSIGRVTAINFALPSQWMVDAGYSTAGEPSGGGTAFPTGTWAPGLVDRNSADTVGFQFSDVATAIPPGGMSTVLVVETNATSFTAGKAAALDGGTANFNAFQPTVIPEPATATALLIGLGILALTAVRRYRHS